MGALRHGSGQVQTLSARVLVGRSGSCVLRINEPRVSGEHATIFWDDGWRLRDLGSRNGTFVGGRRLQPGQEVSLDEGAVIGFGDADDDWVLADATGPIAFARCAGRVRYADGGILVLPDDDDPSHLVFEDARGGWVVEADETREIFDQDAVVVGGEAWRLFLPTSGLLATLDAGAMRGVRFAVSRDEEYLEVYVHTPAGEAKLEHRAYHYMLLTLARERLRDEKGGASEGEAGWVHLDDLAKMLRTDRRTINVHICRIRQQAGRAGLPNAGALVERRQGTGQLRIGVGDLRVGSL